MGLVGDVCAADGRVDEVDEEERLGELYDRDPRLPEDPPPPTLASASISSIHTKKNRHAKITNAFFCHCPPVMVAPPFSVICIVFSSPVYF